MRRISQIFLSFAVVLCNLLNSLSGAEPPPAPGYKSQAALMLAIGLKKVKLIDQNRSVPATVREIRDLEYASVDGRSLKLDLYLPSESNAPRPLLVFIHGGGWSSGSRSDYKYYTIAYAEKGYAAATLSYRLVKDALFPACIQDVHRALEWLQNHAKEYGFDPDRVALIGGSAGGHLSMLAGYGSQNPELVPREAPHSKMRIRGIVNLYGPCDLTVDFAKTNSTVLNFFGGRTYDQEAHSYELASPLLHLNAGDPPTLILHGTIDEIVPIAQSDTLASRLKDLKIPVVYDRLEGWPHTMDMAESVNQRCQFFMDQFFEKHLKGAVD